MPVACMTSNRFPISRYAQRIRRKRGGNWEADPKLPASRLFCPVQLLTQGFQEKFTHSLGVLAFPELLLVFE